MREIGVFRGMREISGYHERNKSFRGMREISGALYYYIGV
jgi:hypothetical protein